MDALIRDIWHDLYEKRLWPVALLLIVGLAAVPLVLIKPADPSPAPPAAAVSPETPELASMAALEIEASEDGLGRGSSLDSFEPRNPFKPAAAVLASADSELQSIDQVGGSTASASSSPGGTTIEGGGGGDTGFSPPAGDVPDIGGGTDPGTRAPAPAPRAPSPAPEPQRLTYAVDVTFTGPDEERRIRRLPRLAMLPTPDAPLLVFLGVGDGGNDALFLVDAKLTAGTGEGDCQPSPEECATVSLQPGEIQEFTDQDGNRYLLSLDQIRAVRVEAAARAREELAAQAAESDRPQERLVPLLVDLFTDGGQR